MRFMEFVPSVSFYNRHIMRSIRVLIPLLPLSLSFCATSLLLACVLNMLVHVGDNNSGFGLMCRLLEECIRGLLPVAFGRLVVAVAYFALAVNYEEFAGMETVPWGLARWPPAVACHFVRHLICVDADIGDARYLPDSCWYFVLASFVR
jgi:hypothetical protein